MAQGSEPVPVHCYTNPSFCRQSEYIPEDHAGDLPPPPQFQCGEDLPPPPPPLQMQINGGQSNPAFQGHNEGSGLEQCDSRERYCYLEGSRGSTHRRYASLPVEERRATCNQSSRYEFVQEEQRGQMQRRGSSRYEFIPQQQVQLRSALSANQDDAREPQMQNCRSNAGRYAIIPGDQDFQDEEALWHSVKHASPGRRHISTPQGKSTGLISDRDREQTRRSRGNRSGLQL